MFVIVFFCCFCGHTLYFWIVFNHLNSAYLYNCNLLLRCNKSTELKRLYSFFITVSPFPPLCFNLPQKLTAICHCNFRKFYVELSSLINVMSTPKYVFLSSEQFTAYLAKKLIYLRPLYFNVFK